MASVPGAVIAPPSSIENANDTAEPEWLAYARRRGIVDPRVIELARLTGGVGDMDGRVVFPWMDREGKVIYRTGRAMNGATPKYKHQTGLRPGLYAAPEAWESQRVALVEGHIDALLCSQAGTSGFATAGTPRTGTLESIADKLEVVLVPDNDDDPSKPERWRSRILDQLRLGTVKVLEARVPNDCKDLGDVAERAAEQGTVLP